MEEDIWTVIKKKKKKKKKKGGGEVDGKESKLKKKNGKEKKIRSRQDSNLRGQSPIDY